MVTESKSTLSLYHLPSSAVDRLCRDHRVKDLELRVPDRLVAQGALSAAPLETLDDALSTRVEPVLVHLRSRQCTSEAAGRWVR